MCIIPHRRSTVHPVSALACSAFLLLGWVQSADAKFFLITYGEQVADIGPVATEQLSEVRSLTNSPSVRVGYCYQGIGLFWINFWTWSGTFCLYDDQNNVWTLNETSAQMFSGQLGQQMSPPWTYHFPPGLGVFFLAALGVVGKMAYDYRQLYSERPVDTAAVDAVAQRSGVIKPVKPPRQPDKPRRPTIQEDFSLQQERDEESSAGSTMTRLVSKGELEETLKNPLYRQAVKMVLEESSSLSGLSTDPSQRPIELKKGLDYLIEHGFERSIARPRLMAAVRAVARAQRKRLTGQ